MKKVTGFLSLAFSLVLIIGLLPISALTSAVGGDSDLAVTINAGTESFVPLRVGIDEFRYSSWGADVLVSKENIWYDDDYFNSGAEYDHGLATMSLALSMAAFSSADAKASGYDAEVAGKNVMDMLVLTGFEDIDVSSHGVQPTLNSIGVAFGHKTVDNGYELIVVAVRGGEYEIEWASNLNMSADDEYHTGFKQASDLVLDGFDSYIKDNGITGPLKVWATGYSRGAAVANLFAASLLEMAPTMNDNENVSLKSNDIYAYTFASPQATKSADAHSRKYGGIFNIINPLDLVTKVAPTAWGYARYGFDLSIPCDETLDSETYERIAREVISEYDPGAASLPQYPGQSGKLDKIIDNLSAALGNEDSEKARKLLLKFMEIFAGEGADGADLLSGDLASLYREFPELLPIFIQILMIPGNISTDPVELLTTVLSSHEPELYLAWMLVIDDTLFTTSETPSPWSLEQVNAAVAAGLVPLKLRSGYTQAITRSEFCVLAVSLYETVTGSAITERRAFIDTDDVNVEKAAAIGVVFGMGNDKFEPDTDLTREQAATMLSRLAGAIGNPLPEHEATFTDRNSVSPWAIDAVGQMQLTGIMIGTGNNAFDPGNDYTREQSIVTVMRLFDVVLSAQ